MELNRITRNDTDREIAKLAFGEEVDRVYQDREFAFKSLKSASWKRRYASLSLLHFHWQISDDILFPICELAFQSDTHLQVRLNSLSVLGSLFEHSFDPTISSYLAKIVLDKSCSNCVRRFAWKAIDEIRTEAPIAAQFQNLELDDLLNTIEQSKIQLNELIQDRDKLPDFDRKLMESLARGDRFDQR